MKVLALDLGTKTGWALYDPEAPRPLESGVQTFDVRRGESPGMRFLRFTAWLRELPMCDLYAYELPHLRGGHAAEVLTGMATRVMEIAASVPGAEYVSVHTATLKKHATGNGRAGKEDMIQAARERWGVEPIDDNHADALGVLAFVLDGYVSGV